MRLPIAVSRYKSIGANRAANIAALVSPISQFPFRTGHFYHWPLLASFTLAKLHVKNTAHKILQRIELIKRDTIINGVSQKVGGENGGIKNLHKTLSAYIP